MIFMEKENQKNCTGGLKKVVSKQAVAKQYENYSGRFLEGVQKEEIRQWRQARSRPGEKETLNIYYIEGMNYWKNG